MNLEDEIYVCFFLFKGKLKIIECLIYWVYFTLVIGQQLKYCLKGKLHIALLPFFFINQDTKIYFSLWSLMKNKATHNICLTTASIIRWWLLKDNDDKSFFFISQKNPLWDVSMGTLKQNLCSHLMLKKLSLYTQDEMVTVSLIHFY